VKSSLRHIWFLSAILLFTLNLHAQYFSFKLYNVNDGLPTTSTFGAYQDKYGYLWINAPLGLSRFDGRQFVNYSLADGLPSLKTTTVFQDSKERLWIGTAGGMAQFKNNRFVTYAVSDKLSNTYVVNFIETKNKKLWALTGKGLYQFEDSIWKKINLCPGFENKICRDVIQKDDELYANYRDDILCRTKKGGWLQIASAKDYGGIFNVMSLQNKEVWVSTIKNIYIIRDHQLIPVFKKGLINDDFFSYFIDSKKRLWLGSSKMLTISNPGDWQHFSVSVINRSGYHPNGISEDSNHNIWIGTINGLLKVKDISFTLIDKNNTVPLEGIFNFIPLQGYKFILSPGIKNGMLMYEGGSFKQIMPPHAPGNENYYKDPVDYYTFDANNSLWMITRFKRFLNFTGKTLQDFSNVLSLKTTEHVYDLKYVKSRSQFFICADSTLLYGDTSKLTVFLPHNTGVPIIKPTRILEMQNGLLILYIDGQGIYSIDKANNFISLVKQTGIDGSGKGVEIDIRFYEDADNNFWVGFPGLGLYEYGFTNEIPFLKNHFTITNGLLGNDVLSLTSDRQHRLWVATSTGVDILQKNKSGNWEVFNYAKADELTLNRSDYEKLVTDEMGNVWFSSPNKIIKFNTANITLNKETPHTIIEKVLLAFKDTNWATSSDSLYSYFQLPYDPVLKYHQNSLGIFYNAIDLSTSNSNPEYSYKLLPLDKNWSIPSKTKSVSFAQLPAGKYQFIIRAKDLASDWSEPAVFRFTIEAPFWEAWWFRLAVIAIAACVIITIFRTRIKQIRHDLFIQNQLKELEMKALKAQMSPHFIYNALNSIQALIANDKKEEGIRYIGSFSKLLRQVLDNSENNVINLDKELQTIGLYIELEALRLDMQLQYKKFIPENIVTEFEKIPPLILQPFVENALWHGLSNKQGEKEIKITINIKDNWLLCDIMDNGIGRSKAQELKSNASSFHQSKGIDITYKRLTDFNEDASVIPIEFFDLHDAKNDAAGTLVVIRIKRKSGI
jgi:ligand-binding sensor domain-containing protein